MSVKILLITQVFYPDEVSTANLFTNLCSVLNGDNVEVEVWCAQPSYTHFKKQPRKTLFNGFNIFFLPSSNFKKTFFLGRLINYFSFTVSVVMKLLFSKEKSLVFTHTTPPSLGIIISYITAFKRRKFVYILLDIFPEGLVRLGKVSAKNVFVKLWHKLFISSLKRSIRVIVIGRDMKHFIESVYPDELDKIVYIPLWQDDGLIFPSDYFTNEFVIDNGLQNKFVAQYSGNMGLWNEMESLGNAVKRNIKDVIFMFVGSGMRKKELFDMFSLESQNNVISLPFQPKESLSKVLTACNIALVTLREGLEGMAVPSKIYGIMAAGVPVIGLVPKTSEIAYIISEEHCGYVIDPGDVDGLISAIIKMKSDDILRQQMGQNARQAFKRKYTTRMIAERYISLIKEVS